MHGKDGGGTREVSDAAPLALCRPDFMPLICSLTLSQRTSSSPAGVAGGVAALPRCAAGVCRYRTARPLRGHFPVPNHRTPRLRAADGRVDATNRSAAGYGPADRRYLARALSSGCSLAVGSAHSVSDERRPEGDDRRRGSARHFAAASADRNGDRSGGRAALARRLRSACRSRGSSYPSSAALCWVSCCPTGCCLILRSG